MPAKHGVRGEAREQLGLGRVRPQGESPKRRPMLSISVSHCSKSSNSCPISQSVSSSREDEPAHQRVLAEHLDLHGLDRELAVQEDADERPVVDAVDRRSTAANGRA